MTIRHSLHRLLRLRSLLEDVSRVELEAKLQGLNQVESALARSQETARASRQRQFAGIVDDRNADRLEAQAMSEWVARERGGLEKAHHGRTLEVNVAKAAYLERRKESRQVEGIIEAREAAAGVALDRREQRELDDWFGQRSRSARDGKNRSA